MICVDKLSGTNPKSAHHDYDYNFFQFVQSMNSNGDQHALLYEESEV